MSMGDYYHFAIDTYVLLKMAIVVFSSVVFTVELSSS